MMMMMTNWKRKHVFMIGISFVISMAIVMTMHLEHLFRVFDTNLRALKFDLLKSEARMTKSMLALEARSRVQDHRDESQVENRNSLDHHGGYNDQRGIITLEDDMEAFQAKLQANISQVCAKYQEKRSIDAYEAKDKNFDQKIIPKFYLIDDVSQSIYCYNHKAASTSWMSIYTKLYGFQNRDVSEELLRKNQIYRIFEHLQPLFRLQVLQKSVLEDYFTFTVIRHPFDRLLSAFRDRILNGCTGQSKYFVPKIFQNVVGNFTASDPFDENGCIQTFPTFTEFLEYLLTVNPRTFDPHWRSYAMNCAPCLVKYDAIIKLENGLRDQNYVLTKSGIDKLIPEMEVENQSKGGSSVNMRDNFFSKVPCSILEKLYKIYKMDFEMFEYDLKPFEELCLSNK